MKKIYCSCILLIGAMLLPSMLLSQTINFTGAELVGTPTNNSVVINIIPASTIEFFIEYGTSSGSYLGQTEPAVASSNAPYEIKIENLNPNTKYYYRMQYRIPGGTWVVRDEHSFMTQRSKGSNFVFTVTSDIHDQLNSNYTQAMQNIRNNNADFHIDLGDLFYPNGANSQEAVNAAYLEHRDTRYLGAIGSSTPIFLASGNHEEEEGWNLDDSPFSIGVASIQARKAYYPTPVSDGFYTGNTDPLAAIDEVQFGNELREDYYAWEWGDALFIVIDEFQYTMDLPYSPAAGEGNDDQVTGDQWSWTLGEQQYNWLKETLENSTAKYKFVFSHNMLGGITRNIVNVGAGYVRGGAEAAAYFEWGGKNADGSDGFAAHRNPLVFTKTIHQLFVENGVSAYFHGHDHQYVYEMRDGVVYQEVPSPSMTGSGFSGIYTEGTFADYQTIKMLQNSGHLRISIGSTATTVDYINSGTGAVTYSYQIEPNAPSEDHILTMGVDPAAGGSTTPVAGTHTYANNTEVTITANPAEGYVFDHWASDVADAHNATTTVTMNSDKAVTAVFAKVSSALVALDGTVSSNTLSSGTGLSIAHTTGTGENRMTLVGVSWNCGSTNRTISSVTFNPNEGTAIPLTEVITQLYSWSSSNYRSTAIYSMLNPGSAISGTININFSGSVSNGIIAGAANFSGVDQTTPLGTPVGAVGTGSSTSGTPNPAVTLNGLTGDELIFDCVFIGASSTSHGMTANIGQTEIWNILGYTGSGSFNARGSASMMQATGTSATMSWTTAGYGTTATRWAIAAVPIKPATSITTYTINATSGEHGSISPAGTITVGEGNNRTFTITPGKNYEIEDVLVDGTSAGAVATYTFPDIHSDHTIAASFKALPEYIITASAGENGSIIPSGSVTAIKGNDTTFTFIPISGYRVSDVLVDGISYGTGIHYSFSDIAANHSIHVVFEEIPAGSITYLGEIGTATGDGAGTTLEIPVGSAGVSVGNTVIVGFCSRGASTYNEPVVTDDAGNTYELDTFAITYQHGRSYIFHAYIKNALSSGQHIQIATTSVGSRVAVAATFSGIAEVNALDQANGNPTGTSTTNQGNNPTVILNNVTTQNNELVIGVFGTEDASSGDAGIGTWGNDFIAGPTAKSGSTASYLWRISLGYKIVTSADKFTASKTVANNPYWAASLATYKTVSTLPPSSYNILLGRPTHNSITLNTILQESGDVYYEYGTTSGIYSSGQTVPFAATANEPVETKIDGLSAHTKYYYRLQFRPSGTTGWIAGSEHSFQTQRSDNETFTFTLISDSHLGQTFSGNTSARYNQTTLNVAADHPDFHIDLGDAFIMENTENQTEANNVYLAQRPYFGNFSHSTPVFLAIGNHENEEGWNLDDTPFSTGLGSINARKEYFLNPIPDAFYTGDDSLLVGVSGDQLREDYYAWEWGDALFVVLDPYQYTMNLPYSNVTGSGEENDETVGGDQWNWTLGKKQYNWLKHTLENSTARYKFVFSHHVTGGQLTISNSSAGPATYVRGGAMAANYFEWGGLSANGSNGFESKRPGWNGDPVHQLLVENNVTAYFHGHDHQFVHEEIDGIVYQLVPTPGMEGYGFDLYDSSPYAKSGGNLPDPGHIRVIVSPQNALLEYVSSETGGGGINGQVAYSYTMQPAITQPSVTITAPNGGEKWNIGTNQSITWNSSGVTGNVRIEYSANNGSTWTEIVSSTENDGSYVWTIPNTPSTSCIARVRETDGDPTDISNAVFEIGVAPEYHFTPVQPINNGYDHMNFYALTAKIDGIDMQPGDEIGIYDGGICVGAGKITQILNGADINLSIKISRDDPDVPGIDGFTAGNTASFRLWDASEETEISTVSVTYSIGNNVFAPSESCWFYIEKGTLTEQQIELLSGWNIFSLYVTPEDIDMQAIVQPLIDAGRLIKVQNETGDAIEQHAVTNNWFNDIRDWSATEGYKIKVSVDTILTVKGSLINNVVNIDLLKGWNIISYPLTVSQDGMTVVNPLITAGNLIKVQNESGDAIEKDPEQSWFNDIETFDADEGYKVNVSSATSLTIDASVFGSILNMKSTKNAITAYSPKSTLKSTSTVHFNPIWTGNGLDHMNIYISETSDGYPGLMPGDEIGIFDGDICVGSGKVTRSGVRSYSFVASADDPDTDETDGFIKGNNIELKLWRCADRQEISLEHYEFLPGYSRVYESMSTAWIRVESKDLNTEIVDHYATGLGNNYPNPFSGQTTIEFALAEETHVNLEVFDVLGNKVRTLVSSTLPQGKHSIVWEAACDNREMPGSGIYFLKMTAGDKVFVKTMILIQK